MFTRIHQKFGTAGLVVAIAAMVAALAGGAYAAGGGLNGQQKKEVKKIAKLYAGKQGPTGPQGPQGPSGAAGTSGADGISPVGTAFSGENGSCKEGGVKFVGANTTLACNGVKGTNGTSGTSGKSVEVGTATTGPSGECEFGGATVQVAGEPSTKKAVCNGQTGFTDLLPPGKTETGGYALSGQFKNFNEAAAAASFSIPLPNELTSSKVHAVKDGQEFNPATESFSPAVHCLGSVAAPTAPAGELCVYVGSTLSMLFEAPLIKTLDAAGEGASKTGALLVFLKLGEGFGSASGSYAVRAPTP